LNSQEFNNIVDAQFEMCRAVLSVKASEYSSMIDRLHNFRTAADLKGTRMREALGGMMVKHTISLYDMIADSEPNDVKVWEEKITDHINYLVLLMAVVLEESTEADKQGVSDA
jgi:hypothetical protein